MTDTPTPQGSATATLSGNLWAVLVLFCVVMLVGGTDMTKVVVAVPSVSAELGLGSVEALWVADSYALAAGVVLILAAVAADRYGRRRLYLWGLVIAAGSAALAGFAPTGGLVIAGRIGQGVGAGLLIAATVAIIRVSFPGRRLRAMAYGVWVIGFSTGSALGPLLGGVLVEAGSWRSVFWINVPILLVCLLAARKVLAESKNPDPPILDAASAALSAAAVGLLVAGLKATAAPGIPGWVTPAALSLGVVAVVSFVVRQPRLRRPFLDLSLLRRPLLASSAATIVATVAVFNGALYLLTRRFQVIEGLTAIETGLALLPLATASAAGGILGPMLQRWLADQRIITTGLAMSVMGLLVIATTTDHWPGMLALGAGAGIIMAIGANAIMSSAPQRRTADAGAIQETAFTLGAGAGIAGFGTLAIHHATSTPAATEASIYGPGTDTALGLAALLYASFALAAALIILATTPPPTAPSNDRTHESSATANRGH